MYVPAGPRYVNRKSDILVLAFVSLKPVPEMGERGPEEYGGFNQSSNHQSLLLLLNRIVCRRGRNVPLKHSGT